jgi:hypothetical protein
MTLMPEPTPLCCLCFDEPRPATHDVRVPLCREHYVTMEAEGRKRFQHLALPPEAAELLARIGIPSIGRLERKILRNLQAPPEDTEER